MNGIAKVKTIKWTMALLTLSFVGSLAFANVALAFLVDECSLDSGQQRDHGVTLQKDFAVEGFTRKTETGFFPIFIQPKQQTSVVRAGDQLSGDSNGLVYFLPGKKQNCDSLMNLNFSDSFNDPKNILESSFNQIIIDGETHYIWTKIHTNVQLALGYDDDWSNSEAPKTILSQVENFDVKVTVDFVDPLWDGKTTELDSADRSWKSTTTTELLPHDGSSEIKFPVDIEKPVPLNECTTCGVIPHLELVAHPAPTSK